MSRSFKKNPVTGNTVAESEKKDKQLANRSYRRTSKQKIENEQEPPLIRENSNVWSFDKDGKHWSKNQKDLRK